VRREIGRASGHELTIEAMQMPSNRFPVPNRFALKPLNMIRYMSPSRNPDTESPTAVSGEVGSELGVNSGQTAGVAVYRFTASTANFRAAGDAYADSASNPLGPAATYDRSLSAYVTYRPF
jgi:hypothetical protein